MGKAMVRLKKRILVPELSLDEQIFNLLCFVGIFALIAASFIRGLWFGHSIFTTFFTMLCGLIPALCIVLLRSFKLHRSVISLGTISILNILFPIIFFTSGGIHSGMTAYFVLSMALIFMLTSGRICAIMTSWHICMALACYYLSYTFQDLVMPMRPGIYMYLDCILAVAVSGLLPSLLIKTQTDAYVEEKIKAQTATKARTDFLTNMSHEIRTPLNAIIGVSEIEMRSTGDKETIERLKNVYDSGISLLGIINDILDISKMESGHYKLFPDKYDSASMILDTASYNTGRLEKRPIEFRLFVDPNTPRTMFGDETAIKQIINNLLSNAFKYTDEGFVDLIVSQKTGHEDGYMLLCITVRDTGRGMRPEDLGKIFSSYNKLDRQATAAQGIGIGLPICEKLVTLMGGTIAVESEYGKGSTFSAIIPQIAIDPITIGKETAKRLNSTPGKIRSAGHCATPGRFAGNALVVDDVEINLEIAQSMLEEYGLKVDTASRGEQAVEMVRSGETSYDIIFMDHMMPGMNGEEAVMAIRKLGGKYAANVPIVGLTARERGNESFFKVIQDLVSKPVDMRQMEKVLEKWLSK